MFFEYKTKKYFLYILFLLCTFPLLTFAQSGDFTDNLAQKINQTASIFKVNIGGTPRPLPQTVQRKYATANISFGFQDFAKKIYCGTISFIGMSCINDEPKTFTITEPKDATETILNNPIAEAQNIIPATPTQIIERVIAPVGHVGVSGVSYEFVETRLQAFKREILAQVNTRPVVVSGGISINSIQRMREGLQEDIREIENSALTSIDDFTTDNLTEGITNIYFTNNRAIDAITGQNISLLVNDSNYLTSITGLAISDLDNDAGFLSSISGLNISELTNDSNFISDLSSFTTDNLAQGSSNLYSQWSTSGSDVYYAGGNVGIGTVNPAVKLTLNNNGGTDYSMVGADTNWDIALGISANTSKISGMDFKNFNASGQVRLMARANDDGYIVVNAPGSSATATFLGQAANTGHFIFTTGSPGSAQRNLVIGTLTAKDIHFGTNNATNMTLQSGGNLGIGTTGPQAKLHVVATAISGREGLFKGAISDSGNDAFYIGNGTGGDGRFSPAFQSYVDSYNSGYSQAFWGMTNAANDASDSSVFGLTHIAGMRTNNASDPTNGTLSNIVNRKIFTVGGASTDIYMTVAAGGNVGIGTTTPNATLDVVGNAQFSDRLNIGLSDSTPARFLIQQKTSPTGDIVKGGVTLSSRSVGMLIEASGTNSGDNNVRPGIYMFNSRSDGAGLAFPLFRVYTAANNNYQGNIGASFNAFALSGGDDFRYLYFGVKDKQAFDNNVVKITESGLGVNLPSTDVPLAGLDIRGLGATSATDAFRIRNTSNTTLLTVRDDGNVGIGTTNPATSLQVGAGNMLSLGAGGTAKALVFDNVNAISGMQMGNLNAGTSADFRFLIKDATDHYFTFAQGGINNNGTYLGTLARSSTDAIFNSGGTARDMAIFTGSSQGNLIFGTNNAERMRIDSSGNVGIGTTVPDAPLHMRATRATMAFESSGLTGNIPFTDTASMGAWASTELIGAINQSYGANGGLTFAGFTNAADKEAFTLQGHIGSASPTANAVSIQGWKSSGTTRTAMTGSEKVFGISAGNATPFFIAQADGNVGVGTTAPRGKLEVWGVAPTSQGQLNLVDSVNASTNTASLTRVAGFGNNIGTGTTGRLWMFGSASVTNHDFIITTDPAGSNILLNPAGNVGIGTTDPSQKLHVAGNARFESVGSGAYAFDLNLTSDGTLTTSASDQRLKTNITTLDSNEILEKITQLNPTSFTWKSNSASDIGLIAQEVENIFPELVFTNQTDGFKGINYSRISTLLISAVSEIAQRVEIMFAWFGSNSFNVQGDICVDDVCISKDQFKNLIQNGISNVSSSINSPSNSDSNTSSDSNVGGAGSDSNEDDITNIDNPIDEDNSDDTSSDGESPESETSDTSDSSTSDSSDTSSNDSSSSSESSSTTSSESSSSSDSGASSEGSNDDSSSDSAPSE